MLSPNIEAKIVDPDSGLALPPNRRGELLLRGPTIMKGMVREPKYSHLKDLHEAIKLCEPAMISSDPEYRYLGPGLEREDEEAARLYEEFVESFKADDVPGGKAFVMGGTINLDDQ